MESAARKRKGDNPHVYVDSKQTRRPFLSLMSKIRATQCLGAALTGKGRHSLAYGKYKSLINGALDDQMRDHFEMDLQLMLEDALTDAEKKEGEEAKAWVLRTAIDTVYDRCIADYNVVSTARPPSLHSQIKDTINLSHTHIEGGDYQRGIETCTNLLKKMINSRVYREQVSPAAKKLVSESLETVEMTDDKKSSASKVRATLDRIYNEIRLPDVYAPSGGPQMATTRKHETGKDMGMMTIDFRQRDGSLFEYNIQLVDDKVMGGSSSANALLEEKDEFLRFDGSVSKSNRGGFASFRIVPSCGEELRKVIKGTKEFILEVKNLDTKNIRYKFQMANEAHLKSFNWQSEFQVEADNEFHFVRLNILSFWPTMFGHVLSSPGNVDFSKVDCLGLIISHVTVDGKENPHFVEGSFGLAVRSIRIVKDDGEEK